MCSSHGQAKLKTLKLIFVAAPLSKQHLGESKEWLAQNQDNVSEWSNMSICGLLFQ
jgi:hypothetical protein